VYASDFDNGMKKTNIDLTNFVQQCNLVYFNCFIFPFIRIMFSQLLYCLGLQPPGNMTILGQRKHDVNHRASLYHTAVLYSICIFCGLF